MRLVRWFAAALTVAVLCAGVASAATPGGWVSRGSVQTDVEGRVSLREAVFGTPEVGWSLTEDWKVWKTVDGGSAWTTTPLPNVEHLDQFGMPRIAAVGADDMWMAGESAVVYTHDGGATWQSSMPAEHEGVGPLLHGVHFVDGVHGWVCGEERFSDENAPTGLRRGDAFVARTNDGGATWQVVSLPASAHTLTLRDVFFTGPSRGFAVGRLDNGHGEVLGVIYSTTDGGATWSEKRLANSRDGLCSVDFADANSGWVTDGGGVFRTDDGGASWSGAGYPKALGDCESIAAVSAQEAFVCAPYSFPYPYQMFHTDNGGATWEQQRLAPGIVTNVQGVAHGPAGVWAAGSIGRASTLFKFDPNAAPVTAITPIVIRSPKGSSYGVSRRKKFKFSATVTRRDGSPVRGKTVQLQVKEPGHPWMYIYILRTNSEGKVSKSFYLRNLRIQYWRWYVEPDGEYEEAASTSVKLIRK